MHKLIVFFFAILLCLGCQNWQLNNSSDNNVSHNKQQEVAQQPTQQQDTTEHNDTTHDDTQQPAEDTKSNGVVDLSFGGNDESSNSGESNANTQENTIDENVVVSDSTNENIAEEKTAQESLGNTSENHFSEEETIEETYMEEAKDSSSDTSVQDVEETTYEEEDINEGSETSKVDTETATTDTDYEEENNQQDSLAREAKMKAEKDRLAREAKMKAEKDRLAREAKMKAEQQRLAKIQAEKERLAREAKMKAEQEKKRYWNSLLAKQGTFKYDIYIDKTKRGHQTTTIFTKNGDIIVKLDVTIDISTWYYSYKFKQTSTEVWRNDVVQSYDCFQDDNGTKTNLKLQKMSSGYTMTFKGKTTKLNEPVIPGSSWNLMEAYDKYPSFLVIDGGLGTTTTYAKSKVKFHNDENVKVGNTYMKCKHFSPTTGEKWSAWYSTDGTFVRYKDVVDGYLYDTILTSVARAR
ncbi:DUF6134 family protein [Candidatus Uabimicrobium amorphum]|uniref:Uncharacterized protein n=1 Tax=Uabimicrobium amorphum TaxID=2596890 RepID=A0A5S9F2F0_UABAM|nr:DUF6134 family protein [Candidatus Uabimicrobium amorphum]BBM82324.1 hypothetical protein UABAM_00667 [Candidatus Uabimicrobium amorphum]